MTSATKKQLLEEILDNTAEKVGDITPYALKLFYTRCPEAKQKFASLGYGNAKNLELSMVDAALYCLMAWLYEPNIVRSKLENAVPLHDYWEVSLLHIIELQRAVFHVVGSAIDDKDTQKKELLSEIETSVLSAIEDISQAETP
ncbi:hypothetical protein R50073_42470 [Maricurvus nonylphenolicus]|uniref:hypothetical protein n=1 Tax=Maricurvus nonylphenolicus TaxID=1008307 RepID=UPI0036F2618C